MSSQQLNTVMLWEFFLLSLLLLKVIQGTQSISSLQKISLEQLLFEYGSFSEPLVFEDIYVCLFYKSLLPFLPFMNCKIPYLAEGFLDDLSPCSMFCLQN